MDPVLRVIELLADLHRSTVKPAALERLLEPLGELLGATAVALISRGGQPRLLGSAARGGRPGAWSGTWWVRWMELFSALPTDGRVRRGFLLPDAPAVAATPAGWGSARLPRGRARLRARPVLAQAVMLGRAPVRLILLRDPGETAFSVQEARLLQGLFTHIQIQQAHGRRLERLRRATVTDDLTRIYNYRFLKRSLHASLQGLRRCGGTLSVLMVDVDNLREYNNHFGHLAASRVLAEMGELLRRAVGRRGWVAKYGGDEFLIVLPRTGRLQAHAIAERLRRVLESAHLGSPGFGGTTCSFGVAAAPADGDAYVPLLEAADQALFRAKALGRNTVVDADALPAPSRDRAA